MTKRIASTLIVLLLMTAAAVQAAAEDQKFTLGAGIGIAYPGGLSYPGAPAVDQLLTIGVTGTYFTNSWVMIAADFSYGLLPGENEFRFDTSGDYFKVDGWAWNFDLLVGVDKQLEQGGFLYAAAGLGIASSKSEFESYDVGTQTTETSELDAGTKAGLSLGAGAGLPIGERMLGFVNLRYRLIKSDAEITEPGDPDVTSLAYGLGGTELMLGIAFWL